MDDKVRQVNSLRKNAADVLFQLGLILPTPNQIGPVPNCICESTEIPLMKMKLGFSDFCTQSHTQVRLCHPHTQHHLSHERPHPRTLVGISLAV